MQTKTALVGTDCAVELNSVTCVDVYLTVIVDPRNTELDLSFGIDKSFKESLSAELLLVLFDNRSERFKNLLDCLMEFILHRILVDNLLDYFINV